MKNLRRTDAGREASERLAQLRVSARTQQFSRAGAERTIRRRQDDAERGNNERQVRPPQRKDKPSSGPNGFTRVGKAVRGGASGMVSSTRPEQERTDPTNAAEAVAASRTRAAASRTVGGVPGGGTVVGTVSSRSGVSENTEAVGQRFAKDGARRGGLRTARVAGRLSRRSAAAASRGAKGAATTVSTATRTSGAAAARAAQSAARATVRSAQAVATLVRSLVAVVAGTATSAPFLVGLVSVLSVVAVVASIIAAIFPTVNNTVSCTAPPKNAVGVAFGGYGPEQLKNASEIIRAGKDAKLDTRDITIGVMVAMGESSLRILAYGDAAGPDSRGLFQQRDSWGPLSVRMDAYGSAGLFFNALKRVDNRPSKQPTIVAHETQRNADPNHYTKFWESAVAVVSGSGASMAGCDLGGSGVPGDLGKGDDYPFNSGEYNATNPVTGLAFKNCTDFAWWRLMQQLGITDQAKMDARPIGPGNGATWADAWKRAGWEVSKTPKVGAIIWYGIGNPGGHPVYGHVAVVKAIESDGKVIEEGYNMAPDKLGAYYTRTIYPGAPSGYLLIPTPGQYAKAI